MIEHHGEFFDFDAVMFEPKPVQKPAPPIHVGGESAAALRRAAAHGDGWLGLTHTPDSAAKIVAELRRLRAEAGRAGDRFEVSVGAQPADAAEVRRFAEAGVDRIITSPWKRSREYAEGMRRFAESVLG